MASVPPTPDDLMKTTVRTGECSDRSS